ncbi:MAG: LamG domain-containing protein [Planctomycetes bacterium]|nr:LamG domain-containing protein [Planctomycetota bacterium]
MRLGGSACLVAVMVCLHGLDALGADEKGLLGHWRLDEGKGDVATDSSGHGHHGKISSGRWVRGPFGVALQFNGESAHVVIPEIRALNGSDQLTVEAWVFWEGMGRYPNILTGGAWNPGGFLMFASDDLCSFRLGKPGAAPWELGKTWSETGAALLRPFSLGRWYHLAATFNRPTLTTYVDGQPVAGAQWNFPLGHSGEIVLGKWGLDLGPTMSHHGLIDEVKIYNRALTQGEIASSHQKEAVRRKPRANDQ